MTLQELFEKAGEDLKKLKKKPTGDDRVELFAVYMQAFVGDASGERPSMIPVAEWNYWRTLRGFSQNIAKKYFIRKVRELKKANK